VITIAAVAIVAALALLLTVSSDINRAVLFCGIAMAVLAFVVTTAVAVFAVALAALIAVAIVVLR
jgi:hypothetical protein